MRIQYIFALLGVVAHVAPQRQFNLPTQYSPQIDHAR